MIRIFRHYLPKALLVLGLAEVVILLFAMYIGASVRFVNTSIVEVTKAEPVFSNAIIFAALMVFVMTAFGLYQRDLKEGEWGYFPRLGVSFVVGLALMSLLFYLMPSLSLSRGVVGFTFVFALIGLTAARYFYLKLTDHDAIKRRVLVLGTGSRALRIGELERAKEHSDFHVVGYLPINGANDNVKALPDIGSLQAVVEKYRVEEIVVGLRDRRGALPIQEILQCKLRGVQVIDLPAFFERETGRIHLETLSPSWLVFADGFQQGSFKAIVKRTFDIVASVALLIFAGPIMLVTALLIYAEDHAPVFYRQDRVGEAGRTFGLLKFRSMRVDAESDGKPQWARKDDDRTTRIGRFIRKVRIDELPQAFNVLLGDMSFVGPRPERPFFVEQLKQQIPYYSCRHTVKPGITGWAQILYPYGASVEDAKQKLQYDLYYVKNNSLFLDLIILFQTVRVLVWSEGAR